LSFIVGICVFNLQGLSLLYVLREAGVSELYKAFAVQALLSGLSYLSLARWASRWKSAGYLALVAGFSAVLSGVLLAVQHSLVEIPFSKAESSLALWALCGFAVQMLRLSSAQYMGRHLSVLSSSGLTRRLMIGVELGALTGAGLHFFAHDSLVVLVLFKSLPWLGLALCLYTLRGAGSSDLGLASPTVSAPSHRPHYFVLFATLSGAILGAKSLQGFGLARGLERLASDGSGLVEIYTAFIALQSLWVIACLGILARWSRFDGMGWQSSYRSMLVFQGFGFVACAAFPEAWVFLVFEGLRRVGEHASLARGQQLLASSLPDGDRVWIGSADALGSVLAYGSAAFASLAIRQGWLQEQVLWAAAGVLALASTPLSGLLSDRLASVYIGALSSRNLGEVLRACFAMSSVMYAERWTIFKALLQRNPRPAILKAALHCLGGMRNKASIETILPYLQHEREDIQLAAVRALRSMRDHETDYALLSQVRREVHQKGLAKITVVKECADDIGNLAIPHLLDAIESSDSHRTRANAIEILGLLAIDTYDRALARYLAKFLSPEHHRRVRSNAARALYAFKEYRGSARALLDQLLLSQSLEDRGAAAHLAGELQIRELTPLLWRWSAEREHQSVTMLIALHKLGEAGATEKLASTIVAEDAGQSSWAIQALSVLPRTLRLKVFEACALSHPGSLDLLNQRLRGSGRFFEEDRELIRLEALRLGQELSEDRESEGLEARGLVA
jgi:HEAT repeat protein